MDKRADLRQYYQAEASKQLADRQHQERAAQLKSLESTVLQAFTALIRFMDGKTTKTEVVNQLKSISTPDVDKVVRAVSKLDADMLASKLDLAPLLKALDGVKSELAQIPKSLPEFEQRDTVSVSNLDEVQFDTTALEKAIKGLKLDPKIDVKSPVVNIDAPDLSPLQGVMLDLLKAVQKQKFEIPAFPKIPKTDLSKVEKKLDESNKHLKAISEKKFGGGGGGGGNGTPYTDESGTPKNVILTDNGSIPVEISVDSQAQINSQSLLNEISQAIQSVAAAKGLVSDLRVTIVGGGVTISSGTVTTLTSMNQMAGLGLAPLYMAQANSGAYMGNINNIARA